MSKSQWWALDRALNMHTAPQCLSVPLQPLGRFCCSSASAAGCRSCFIWLIWTAWKTRSTSFPPPSSLPPPAPSSLPPSASLRLLPRHNPTRRRSLCVASCRAAADCGNQRRCQSSLQIRLISDGHQNIQHNHSVQKLTTRLICKTKQRILDANHTRPQELGYAAAIPI